MINTIFAKNLARLRDSAEKYGTSRQVKDYYIIRAMRIVCWVNNATDTDSE
jgi:hypothetical protein